MHRGFHETDTKNVKDNTSSGRERRSPHLEIRPIAGPSGQQEVSDILTRMAFGSRDLTPLSSRDLTPQAEESSAQRPKLTDMWSLGSAHYEVDRMALQHMGKGISYEEAYGIVLEKLKKSEKPEIKEIWQKYKEEKEGGMRPYRQSDQDTGDIKIEDEDTKIAIINLAKYARPKSKDTSRGSDLYQEIIRTCGIIKLFNGMFVPRNIKQARERYGHQQTPKDIVDAARALEDTVKNGFFNEIPEVIRHRNTISKWVKNIKLPEEQT